MQTILNINAANALLKTLEEPPKNSVFLLISHNPESLLETIKSRCRELSLLISQNNNLLSALKQINLNIPEKDKEIYSLLGIWICWKFYPIIKHDGQTFISQYYHFLTNYQISRVLNLKNSLKHISGAKNRDG